MAKKKKKTVKKSAAKTKQLKTDVPEPSAFWPLAAAVIMMVIALFILIGGFGSGGPLPKTMFHGVYWALGYAAWLTPFALVFFGILKFKEDDRKVPLNRLVGMAAFLIFSSAFFYVIFATKSAAGVYSGGHGGTAGSAIGGATFNILDKVPASIAFFVLALLMFFFAYDITPRVMMKLFKKKEKEEGEGDTDLAALKAKAGESSLKLNEGVPVEHGIGSASRMSTFKNSAQKMVGG